MIGVRDERAVVMSALTDPGCYIHISCVYEILIPGYGQGCHFSVTFLQSVLGRMMIVAHRVILALKTHGRHSLNIDNLRARIPNTAHYY